MRKAEGRGIVGVPAGRADRAIRSPFRMLARAFWALAIFRTRSVCAGAARHGNVSVAATKPETFLELPPIPPRSDSLRRGRW